MKRVSRSFLAGVMAFFICLAVSCDEDLDDTQNCTGCSDDSPYSAVGSDTCYATQSECNDNESGNCVICQ